MIHPRDLETCIAVLEAIADDRGHLGDVPEPTRVALLTAAGRVARPDTVSRRQLARVRRRLDVQALRLRDEERIMTTGMRTTRRASVFTAPERVADPAAIIGSLEQPRTCYVCKASYTELHVFYDSLCPPCAALNYEKRFQTADLRGQIALVTGARIKIGYHTTLMLLRAGARVLATTRFPHDAARRFAREADFAAWADRLEIHGLDLRHAPTVELFAASLGARLPRLDVLVNNAAQTVRRPPGFYTHLAAAEKELTAETRPLLAAHEELRAELGERPDSLVSWHDTWDTAIFPAGSLDADLQQVDLRPVNTWRLTAAEVGTPELLEVHLVNAVAPFILASRLKPLMTRGRTDARHVINVSAMEAQFSRRKKTDKHPHTNMAKAALNMLTRTSAVDYASSGIFMNSVDTGWITDEDPLVHVERKNRVHGFNPPLDIVDGAARILDPLFSGLRTGSHPWGLFFKDYRPVDW